LNKIIRINVWNTDKEVRDAMKRIVDQIEKHNYAICGNRLAVRLFSRSVPETYRRNNTIMFTRNPTNVNYLGVITVQPNYHVERKGKWNFRIRIRK